MAKSSTFFGLRRGSTKSLTFAVNNGQQVTKDRVSVVKNPRSQAQMVQRAIMKTASSAYNAGKKIFDHSFEGTSYGQPSMSLFRSLNSQMLRQNLPNINISEWSAESDAIYPNPYIVSKGTLPTAHAFWTHPDETNRKLVTVNGKEFTPLNQDALLEALGAQVGDMLTVLIIDSDHKFSWCRIKINGNTYDSNFITFEMSDPNAFNASWTVADGKGTLAVSSQLEVEANATILSRKGNNVWLRSPEQMVSKGTLPTAHAYWPHPDEDKEKLVTVEGKEFTPLNQDALLEALGAQVGDMLTVLIIDSDHRFSWCRIKINGNTYDSNFITFEMSDPTAFNATWTVADGKGTLSVSSGLEVEANATILSRKGNNVWLRSPEQMVSKGESNYDDVIGDYPVGDAYILNGGKK